MVDHSEPTVAQVRAALLHLLPFRTLAGLWRRRELIGELVLREVQKRYRGSMLGVAWAFLLPLTTLIVYTTVFSGILKTRWGDDPRESAFEFGLTMFAGLIVFDVFSEILQTAPRLIVQNTGYVKKVIFPLEVLPVAALGSALIHGAFSLVILSVGLPLLTGHISLTVFLFPLVALPLIMLTLGIAWFVASLGVFLRDVDQVLSVIARLLFFVTPIFYPNSLVPGWLRWALYVNPLAVLVEQSRRTLVWNQPPQWFLWGSVTVVSLIVMQLGYAWFMETKRGFADVL